MNTFAILRHAALAISLSMTTFSYAADSNADIYGTWKIKTFVGAAEVSALSQQEVDHLIGAAVSISPQKFVFNGQTCQHPNYERSTEDAVAYFEREWRADAKELHFGKTVTIVATDCNMLYPIRKNHLIVAERGNFFEAVRVSTVSVNEQAKLPKR